MGFSLQSDWEDHWDGKLEGEPELTCTLAFREIQKIVKLSEKIGKKLGAYVYILFTLVKIFRIK